MRVNPTLRGIVEHLERARLFATGADAATSLQDAFRYWIAATYSVRAILQLLRDAAKRGELHVDAQRLDRFLEERFPRYRLVRRLRIDDFHRFGLLGPGHMRLEHTMRLPAYGQGNIELTVNDAAPGLRISLSDGSRDFRFFLISGMLVQDEKEPVPVPIPQLVREQIGQIGLSLGTLSRLFRN